MFRIDPNQPFNGPHQGQYVARGGAPLSRAKAVMVLVHGRGASAKSMLMLAEEFAQPDVAYLAPQAQMHTWYPFSFLAPKQQNQPGISSGLQAIHDLVEEAGAGGYPKEKIMLLGFSQGACLTLEFVARHPKRYGAVFGLSGGLIGQSLDPQLYEGDLKNTPVFLGCSDVDPHIPKERVDLTAKIYTKLNADVDKRIYPNMGHTVNEDELKAIRGTIAKVVHKES